MPQKLSMGYLCPQVALEASKLEAEGIAGVWGLQAESAMLCLPCLSLKTVLSCVGLSQA